MPTRARPNPASRFQVRAFRFEFNLSCVGYAGYIPGTKSEGVFAQTYGNATLASKQSAFHVGRDQPPHIKYNTTTKDTYVDHSKLQHETVAQIVGVDRAEPRYARPIPPATVARFFNMDAEEQEDPFKAPEEAEAAADEGQTEEQAINAFYGNEAKKEGLRLGTPIPGYSGTVRRVEADNVFGMTYAEAQRRAKDSLARINAEKGETLKMSSTWQH